MTRDEAKKLFDIRWKETIANLKGKTDWYQEQLKGDARHYYSDQLNKVIDTLEAELKTKDEYIAELEAKLKNMCAERSMNYDN